MKKADSSRARFFILRYGYFYDNTPNADRYFLYGIHNDIIVLLSVGLIF